MDSYLTGKTFSVTTLGCRVNHYEAEAAASMLEARGAVFTREGEGASPDIVLIVTCSVTSAADAKTRKIIRRARRLHPDSAIVACGCWAQAASSGGVISSGADIIIGNRLKRHIADELENWYASAGEDGVRAVVERRTDVTKSRDWDSLSLDRTRILTRAFIKIQDGCDRRCSYCAVPFLRGGAVSRDAREVLDEIGRVVANGAKEVILTGVQLGGYQSGEVSLARLVGEISCVGGLRRLRMGSLEPFAVTGDLLRACRGSEIFCPHLHIPIQSGDDETLRAMRRGYGVSDFERVVELARACLGDDAHISTDLIVGFPGETEKMFENSLKAVERLRFGKVHVFPYSPRAGTASSQLENLPAGTVKKRTARALDLSDHLAAEYASRFVARNCGVLAENVDGDVASGWSEHYLRMYFRVSGVEKCVIGNVITVKPKISIGSILLGEEIQAGEIAMYKDEGASG
ncbi:MAG: tRNA (N(6)-L-threonylcarbamoyladenosine(37)-C(2))-methylthiotransferase MtaB [Synergistaceae bacterium]|jgi:threonylcarbamoyladenosine tRNA methylthiotransferase MtaB|nr:tRNA (N(6)-L-threonylcarbamoyladenosine(37)-C(2))-methylthiotransferase MtaB [Synergistaceae bacterium]